MSNITLEDLEDDQQHLIEQTDIKTLASFCYELQAHEEEIIRLEELVKDIKSYNDHIKDNAGGAYNHQLFFNMMKPGGSDFTGEIKDRILKRFGTFGKFKKEFIENAKGQFGSGWGWLVEKNGRLDLVRTPNQDNPLMFDLGKPVLGVDVWEHSYYLMYGPKRQEWLQNFFDIVNWDFCSALLHTS